MRLLRPLLRIAAVSCVVALVVLSWLPKDMEIRTGVAGQIEHMVAYAGTMLVAGLAWPLRRPFAAAGLLALGAVLETGQILVPGRTAQLVDLAASAAGTLVGYAVAAVAIGFGAHWTRDRAGSAASVP